MLTGTLADTLLGALLAAVPYVLFVFGIGCLLTAITEAAAETLAPETTRKVKAAVRDLLHDRFHVGDPRTKTQRAEDDAFMAIVATYHREN